MYLKTFNELFEHKIVDGSEYQWQCWPSARYLDYKSQHAVASVIFNTQTQEVYEVTVQPQCSDKIYRWHNPNYLDQYKAEAKERSVDYSIAWDDVRYIDLEVESDLLDKARAIWHGLPYDERIVIPVDFSKDELFLVMRAAHEEDLTLNQYMEKAIQTVIDQLTEEQ